MTLLQQSLSHTWAPFVLILGLLFVGHAAASDGLFEYLGDRCSRLRGNDAVLFVAVMLAVALVTALLNLDTAVVFMTPVALQAARSRSADETAFLYGTIVMSNAASLLLVGSNLTNLLVFASRPVGGAVFASRMLAPWLVSVALTIAVVGAWRSTALRRTSTHHTTEARRWRGGVGVLGVAASLAFMLLLSQPALAVLGVGVVVEALEWWRRHEQRGREILRTASLEVVVPLFVLAVGVGWLGRRWAWPGHLVAHASAFASAGVAALASVAINNLPAASLFAGRPLAHPYAVLIGLDLGPNLFVSGAMSTLLWFRIARANDAAPRARTFVAIGAPIALLGVLLTPLVL